MGQENSPVGVQPMSPEQVQAFMEGNQTMEGGRFDTESRGLTTEDPTFWKAQPAEPAREADFQQAPPTQNFQQLYGQEANEKGQWRRTAEAALAQLEAIKAELALRPPIGAPNAAYPAQGAYSNVQPQITPSAPPAIPKRFLPERDLNDAILVEDVERVLQEMVAPEIWQLRMQNAHLQSAQVNTLKAQAGLSPLLESQLIQAHPWLASIVDPFAQVHAMKELVEKRAAEQAQAVQQLPPQPQQRQGNLAQRRVTMIESMQPRTSEADMDTQEVFRREMAAAMQLPFGAERSDAMRKVFAKYGVTNSNDFGPGVLTR